jgi:hypothetical protein
MQIGLPPNVEIVFAFQACAISSVVIVAPTGQPFAMPLAMTMMSGSTSKCWMPNQCSPSRPKPGLHLVDDQEAAVRADDLRRPPQVSRRRDDVAAHALHRLGDERGRPAVRRGDDDLLEVGDPLVVHDSSHGCLKGQRYGLGAFACTMPGDGRRQWPPARVRRHAGRHHRAAVVGEPQRDDLAPARRQARHHERRLDRLRARVAEERPLERAGGDVGDLPRGLDLHLGRVQRRDVSELAHLLRHRGDHVRVAVADRRREDAREEVEVLAALRVAHAHPVRLRDHERLAVQVQQRRQQVLALPVDGLRARGPGGQGLGFIWLSLGSCCARAGWLAHHRSMTTRWSVKNETASRPCALRSP